MLILQYKDGVTSPSIPVSGATIHVRADTLTGLSNGDQIIAWDNEGSLGGTFTPSPIGVTYHTNVINGLPVARSTNNNSALSIQYDVTKTISDVVGLDAGTIYIVHKQVASDNFNGAFTLTASSVQQVGYLATWNNILYYDHGNNSGGFRIQGAQPTGWDDTFHYSELYRDGSTTAEINVDGSNIVSSSMSGVMVNHSSPSVWLFLTNTSQYLTGDIAELIVFPTALSAPDRASMISYLTTKYGL